MNLFSGLPGHPNAMANTIGPGMVQVVVNPSSSVGLPTSYSVTISNSSYVYSNSTPAFLNGSAMVTFTGLTIGTNYTISAVAINCAGSSNSSTCSPATLYMACTCMFLKKYLFVILYSIHTCIQLHCTCTCMLHECGSGKVYVSFHLLVFYWVQ